ncbi:MAG: O-antigen ligase family protein [Bacteroidales bacterium]|nr:O-antigen ligase family protein [Bacteroidales bacterium]MCB8999825.1 O-antigen ligase family protein [Bacteroidales bacterium]
MPGESTISFKNFSGNYYILLIILAASLPVSVFATSLAEILIAVNWIAEGDFKQKGRTLKERKAPLIIAGIYAIHLLGLINTSDFTYGFHDLKIKLPVLLLPILIGSSNPISEKQLRTLLLFFSASVLVSSFITSSIFFGIVHYEYVDFRDMSIFISHIRFSLMVNLAVFCLLFYGFGGDKESLKSRTLRIILVLAAVWLSGFLIILKSVTGIIIFIILSLFMAWRYSGRIGMVAPRFMVRVLIVIIPLIIASWISNALSRYMYRDPVDFAGLPAQTSRGNPYYQSKELNWIENGHYVWINVCEDELREEWNKKSSIPYDGKDKKGQFLRFTLIRYMTSKGLIKDADGFKSLTEEDIKAVENGVANYIFLKKFSLYPRFYQILWEMDSYRHGQDPSGHSVAQRIEFLRAADYIIRNNFIFGVGTGDVQKAFNNYYLKSDKPLKEKSRRRAHNQYITFFISFGIFGFVLCMLGLFLPPFLEKRWSDYLFMCFALIGFISMLNEDTLETQTGVSFFMFFFALLLFGRKREEGENLQSF